MELAETWCLGLWAVQVATE